MHAHSDLYRPSKHNMLIYGFQCWASVLDGGPALKKHWFNTGLLRESWPTVGLMLGQHRRHLPCRLLRGRGWMYLLYTKNPTMR